MRRLRAQLRLIRLAWQDSPVTVAAIGVVVLIDGTASLLGSIAMGLVVSSLVQRSGNLGAYSLLMGVAFVGTAFSQALLFILPQALGSQVQVRIRERVLRASLRPAGIAHLEDDKRVDQIAVAMGTSGNEGFSVDIGVVNAALYVGWRFQAYASALLLAYFALPAAVLVTAAWLVFAGLFNRSIRRWVRRQFQDAGRTRRANYLGNLLLLPEPAKEIRLFGLNNWITVRFEAAWRLAMDSLEQVRRGEWKMFVLGQPLLLAAHVLAIIYLAHQYLAGALDIRGFAIAVSAMTGLLGFANSSNGGAAIESATEALDSVEELERFAARGTDRTPLLTADGLPAQQIRFEGVRFRYPGRDSDLFGDFDLVIPAGRSTAIVGLNGAGKTTLIKLMARLYEPDAGRITVDGVDLRDLDLASWRRRLAAVFQDFTRFQLSVRDNVTLGAVGHAADEASLRVVAGQVDLGELLEALPAGWDTTLGKDFTGGSDLSGGQWQRLALARALFAIRAGAGVLILDEPTASLDVRAEAALFDRFLDLTAGLTALLVSHRFSTVRRADNIVVIEGGRVIESGSHLELMAAGGAYRRMFDLQAARFVVPPEPTATDLANA